MKGSHVELPGTDRPAAQDLARIRDLDPDAPVEVTVSIAGPPLPEPGAAPPAPLSRSEYAERYGAPEADIQKVRAVLEGYGLTVREISPDRRSLKAAGPASAMEAAFQPHLGVYASASRQEFRGREGPLMIPVELEAVVTGVFGLDQRPAAHPLSGIATADTPPVSSAPQLPACERSSPAGDETCNPG